MKSFVLAAALVALAAPAAFAQSAPKHAAPDTASAAGGLPDGVKAYVKSNGGGTPYPFNGVVQVGESTREVDANNAWRAVPNFPQYSWGNLGGQLVVVDNNAKKVVAIY